MDAGPLSSAVETLAKIAKLPTAEALAQVEAMLAALPSCASPERLEAIAAALPPRVEPLAAELSLALAKLALALACHRPRMPDDRDALSARLRAAWLRVALSVAEDPARLDALDDALLLRTLSDWQDALLEVGAPILLLDRMIGAADPRLRALALERSAAAVEQLALTPEQACARLLRLAEDVDPQLRRAALAALSQQHRRRLAPSEQARRRALIAAGLDDPEVHELCVGLAAELGERELLVEHVFDEAREPGRRARALGRLGELADDDDLDRVLALALDDPLTFAAAAREFLLEAHAHGVFIRDAQVPAALALFDADHGWTGELLVRVTYIARAALLAALAELPADDRRWIRRAAILPASVDTDAHALLARQLRATTDERIAAALLDAAGRSPDFDDEDALLAWLPRLPEPTLAALRVKGSERSVAPLRELVGDRRTPTGLRERAMPTLWALAGDRRALLRDLCERVGPSAAGLFDSSRLSARDGTAAGLLVELGSAAEVEPLAALRLLCEAGKPELRPEVTRLFRVVFTDYVGAALAGDFTIKRQRMPELEQLIYRYGRHLIADGRSVRRWIEAGPDTGDALVLDLAIGWLREQPAPAICVALLETIARKQPTGASLRRIERFWRHGEVEVRRAALEAILAGESDARGLALSIARLAELDEPKLVRQALIGIRTLDARWAEPLVIAALARPDMAIKREAAVTLAAVGSSRCVASLVAWLAAHDNRGFRTDLRAALLAVAGRRALAVLVEALTNADAPRERELLREAISGLPSLRAMVRLARSSHPAHVELVGEALAGRVTLADADARQLAAALYRARLRPAEPERDIGRRLRLDGFSPAVALELLAEPDHLDDPRVLALVRSGVAEWLAWLGGDDGPVGDDLAKALALLLTAAELRHREHFVALLDLIELIVPIVGARSTLSARPVFEFIARCLAHDDRAAVRARALALVRALPSGPELGGPRRYELLGKLGAVRTRADLDRCLDACRAGPDLARESERLLNLALQIPAKHADEARRYDAATVERLQQLREGAKRWYRMDAREAERWLTEQLADRPLDVPAPAPWPWPSYVTPRSEPHAHTRAELDSSLALLEAPDRTQRQRAAERLLAWPAVRELAHARVLAAYLAGDLELSGEALRVLATSLDEWPTGPWTRTQALFDRLDDRQRRQFLPAWIDGWDRAEPEAEAPLSAVDQELLLPFVRARAERGDYVLVRLLRPSPSLALRALVDDFGERARDEFAHLRAPEQPASAREVIVDPIADKRVDELVELIRERDVDPGLAVRAIHQLARQGAGDELLAFVTDPRPRIRSAAFRALRGAVPREQRLAAAVEMLDVETRRDVIASLLASVAHARYQPGFSRVLERLTDRDTRLRDAAEQALLAWGPDCLPLLERAARKARPDRRRAYAAVIAALEAQSE